MANNLTTEKKAMAVNMLCEGNSIRSIERMTGVHRDTIIRLGVSMGRGCKAILDKKTANLYCESIQVDELWGFIGAKQKTAQRKNLGEEYGDIWVWTAIDADTKLVPTFVTGSRDQYHANCFMDDLACRLQNRPQISSDALKAYSSAVERAFGCNVDYGSIINTFSHSEFTEQRRYSPPECIKIKKSAVQGVSGRSNAAT